MSDITATMLQDKLNSIERNAYDGIDFSQEVTTAYVLADELGERIDQLKAENAKLRELVQDYDAMLAIAAKKEAATNIILPLDAVVNALRIRAGLLGIEADE